MKFKSRAKRAGLNESEIRDLRLLAKALGLRIRYVEIVPPGQRDKPRKEIFNYDA